MSLKIIHIHIICILCQPQILSHQFKACGLKPYLIQYFVQSVLNFVSLVGLVLLSYHAFVGQKRSLVGISRVQNLLLWLFRGSKISFHWYFVCSKLKYFVCPRFFLVVILCIQNFLSCIFRVAKIFLVGISCVQNFPSWVFLGFKISSPGYVVCPRFFLVCIYCAQSFFLLVFRECKIFSRKYFVVPNFFLYIFCESKMFLSWVFHFVCYW